ncbi:hypothetical protein BDR26DRAFT_874868 [Obelidium mucronatum]|nr:hypothetical protein BDR26DRAFT_874868 [Obelidium mucronatum]
MSSWRRCANIHLRPLKMHITKGTDDPCTRHEIYPMSAVTSPFEGLLKKFAQYLSVPYLTTVGLERSLFPIFPPNTVYLRNSAAHRGTASRIDSAFHFAVKKQDEIPLKELVDAAFKRDSTLQVNHLSSQSDNIAVADAMDCGVLVLTTFSLSSNSDRCFESNLISRDHQRAEFLEYWTRYPVAHEAAILINAALSWADWRGHIDLVHYLVDQVILLVVDEMISQRRPITTLSVTDGALKFLKAPGYRMVHLDESATLPMFAWAELSTMATSMLDVLTDRPFDDQPVMTLHAFICPFYATQKDPHDADEQIGGLANIYIARCQYALEINRSTKCTAVNGYPPPSNNVCQFIQKFKLMLASMAFELLLTNGNPSTQMISDGLAMVQATLDRVTSRQQNGILFNIQISFPMTDRILAVVDFEVFTLGDV